MKWAEVPEGAELRGLAPIGVRWAPGGTKRRGKASPLLWPRRIARSEFLPTHALVGGVWVELEA